MASRRSVCIDSAPYREGDATNENRSGPQRSGVRDDARVHDRDRCGDRLHRPRLRDRDHCLFSGEVVPARPDRGRLQRVRSVRRRQMRPRHRGARRVRSGGSCTRERLGHACRRRIPDCLGTRGHDLDAASPPAPERAKRGQPALRSDRAEHHAIAARDRDAPQDGDGAWVAGHVDRMAQHPVARARPRWLGDERPRRVGTGPPRKDEPADLDVGTACADRRVLREDRSAVTGAVGPQRPRRSRLRAGCGVLGRPRRCGTTTTGTRAPNRRPRISRRRRRWWRFIRARERSRPTTRT